MRTCPKCYEINGDKTCWKCKTFIGEVNTGNLHRKICPKCGIIFKHNSNTCSECASPLAVYDEQPKNTSKSGCWMYVIAFLIPLIGLILGLIYIAKDEEETGKPLMIFSIIIWVINIFILLWLF